ncbi:PREDICTED: uncharacterized protein LOC105556615 [Vollenhovia emeryi]|uniref:uncharacterized protein LOC105556615 n=1 Tax=Vollenhovia emeryi TaxID=411798 RepID=UPI0005F3C723|nr:PREDICTED: uncharacterized protein LOC105556615 [Vollenhovia emeryi]
MIYSETPKNKNSVLEEERTLMSTNNENQASQNSPPFQGISHTDRDMLTTVLSQLKTLHGPVVSNLDRDLLRDVSSKLDIVLINQRRILNEIFSGETVIERPENCPLPLRDEKSFQAFDEFLNDKIAFS